jgi:EpsI family protein
MRFRRHPVMIITWIIMAAAVVYFNFIPPVDPVPVRRSFIYFPFRIGEWKGKEKVISDYLVTTLGADDILMREYENEKGDSLELYFAYFDYIVFYEYGQDKGPHPPQTCWVGAGWSFKDLGEEEIELGSKKRPHALIKKLLARQEDKKIMMFYLYKLNERYVVDWLKFRGYAVKDSIFKRKNCSFTLQLSSVVGEEGVEYKVKEMKAFLAKVLTILERDYLP